MAATVWGKSQWSVLTAKKTWCWRRMYLVRGFGVFLGEEGLGQRLFWSFRPFCFTVVWLEGQRASSDYRANSDRASTANCFNCQVSWKDCIHVKDERWWSAYCRTEDASAFIVTAGLQRAVCLFSLFPCFCAPQEWCLMLTLKYQINPCYLQAAFFFIFPSCVPFFSNLEQACFPLSLCLSVLPTVAMLPSRAFKTLWCFLVCLAPCGQCWAKYQMLHQIGLFSFIRLAESSGTSTGLVHLHFYWTNSSLFRGPEALGEMTLFSVALFHWGIVFWLLAFFCSMLRTVLWLVEQREMSLAVLGGVSARCSLCLFSGTVFLCWKWMGKGKAEIRQDSGWSSCSWEKVAVSLVWSWPPCCDGIAVALKGCA